MPDYRLKYFTTRGRAEPMRLLFHDAGIEFSDERLLDEEWETVKQSGVFPLNQLPILEIDGKPTIQSRAIMRHLSRKYGYLGSSEEETFRIDVICETIEDLTRPAWDIEFGSYDEDFKNKIRDSFTKSLGPLHLTFLEKALEDNPEGSGYFVGDDATMADFVFYAYIESVENMFQQCLKEYPKLRALRKLVKSRERIALYLAKQIPTFM